jgi:hypothetical protein
MAQRRKPDRCNRSVAEAIVGRGPAVRSTGIVQAKGAGRRSAETSGAGGPAFGEQEESESVASDLEFAVGAVFTDRDDWLT